MPAIENTYVQEKVEEINGLLNGVSFVAYENTGEGTQWMVQRHDEKGPLQVEVIGTAQEAARFLEGVLAALEITRWAWEEK